MIYIAIGWQVWGKGDSIEKAVKNMNNAAGKKVKTYYVREYPDASDPMVDKVDGSIWYKGEPKDTHEVKRVKNGKEIKA